MSNRGSDETYSDEEQDEDHEEYQEGEEEEEGDHDYVGSSSVKKPHGSTRAPNVPLSIPSQWDLYSYGANMTDKQKREQDEQNFAEASKMERKSKSIADSKRRIRFDAKGNLQYSDDPDTSGWRECSKCSQIVMSSDRSIEPAVFHHWIRRELAEAANRRGSYGRPALSPQSLS